MAAFNAGTIEAILRLRDEFTGVAKRVATQAKTLGDRIDRSGAAMGRAGSALTPLSLGVAALGVGALKAAIDFESSFAGVIKTVDDATDSMGRLTPVGEALKQSFRDLALEIPISANELAGIGEVAGQLGIETQNIAGFTETMAKLGVTTNLSAEEAATSLARLANVTGLPQTEFERLGSTVVALGNNLATTESEIVMFGQRIAGAGAIAGLSEPQILAIGGAMSSVGIEAEAGGTAVQKVLLTMNDAVAAGGAELVRFADLSGQSVEQFAAGWRDNAGAQFTAFVEGLAAQGDQASAVLKDLIGTDQRLQRAFLSLAQSGDTLRNAMSLANVAWVENTALAKEAEIRFQTTSAELTILWNNVKDVAISLGEALLPTLKDAVGFLQESVVPVLRDAVKWFEDLSPASKGLAAGFAALIVVATPVLYTLSTMAPLLSVIVGGFTALVPSAAAAGVAVGASGTAAAAARVQFEGLFVASSRAGVAVGASGVAAGASVGPMVAAKIAARLMWRAISGPVGIAITVITAAVGAFKLLKRHIDEGSTAAANFARSQASVDSMTAAIAKLESEGKKVPQSLRDVLTHAEQARDRMKEMAESVDKASESFTAMRDELKALAAKEMAAWANASEEAKKRALELADALPDTEVAMENLVESVRLLASEGELPPGVLRNIAKQALALGIAVEDLPPELQNIVISFDNMARAGRDATEEEARLARESTRLARESTRLKESIQELVDQFQGRGLIQSALEAAEAVQWVGGAAKLSAKDQASLRETLDEAIDAYHRLGETATPAITDLANELHGLANAHHEHTELTVSAADAMDTLQAHFGAARPVLLSTSHDVNALGVTLWDVARAAEGATAGAERLTQSFGGMTFLDTLAAQFEGFGAAIGQTFARALEGGGQWLGAIQSLGVQGGTRLGEALSGGLAKQMAAGTGFLAKGFGAVLGKAAGMAIPLIGPVIGSLIGKLFSLGGPSEAERAGRKTAGAFRDAVIATLNDGQLAEAAQAALGGAWRGNERGAQFLIGVRDAYVSVGKSAAEAEAMVNRLWEAEERGPEAVAAVQREMQLVLDQTADLRAQFEQIAQIQAFDSATDQLQQLTSAAEFFGVEADQMGERLGNAFLAVEQAATAEDIAQHFHTLLASGVELGTALDLAKDKVQGVITASVQMGTEIPASMQPIAEQLIAQGQLLDESGKKITDINQLEFGTSMTEGLQILVLSMNQLVETMGGEIPDAAKQFAEGVSQSATEAAASVDQQLGSQLKQTIETLGGEVPAAAQQLAESVGRSATEAAASVDQQLLAQIEHLGLAVHDLSVKDLATMAATFEATAQAAGLSLEGSLGEKLDALTTGLGSMSRDALPELVRSFQQTATDAVQAFDRIPRTISIQHHTQFTSSGVAGSSPGPPVHAQQGTPFVDFGAGTAAMLHGVERVQTKAQHESEIRAVVRESADLSGLRQELADLKRIMERGQDELPFRLSRAIRDAMAGTV